MKLNGLRYRRPYRVTTCSRIRSRWPRICSIVALVSEWMAWVADITYVTGRAGFIWRRSRLGEPAYCGLVDVGRMPAKLV